MRIAVVGSGISGLVAARLLHPKHAVTVFEASARIGGHTHTVSVDDHGRELNVDTGFIVFNHQTYPGFTRLLDELDVPSQPTTMSFGVRDDRSGLEYCGTSFGTLFAQKRNLFRPSFQGMLADIVRFHREAPEVLDTGDTRTVEEWVAAHRYRRRFVDSYLVPLGASLWSCPPRRFLAFPMRFLVTFLVNHHMLQIQGRPVWRVVTGGSSRYLEPLTLPFRDRIRIGCPIARIERDAAGVTLVSRDDASWRFDHVVLACHSDQALGMLAEPTALEREVVGAFSYQANDVVLHTDTSVLPRARRARASWNYLVPADAPQNAAVTYDMNLLQGLDARETYLVSLNQTERIAPERVLRRMTYEHPLYTEDAERARQRHREVIGPRHTSFCGAYWGFGFHEDGLRSAHTVAEVLAEVAVA